MNLYNPFQQRLNAQNPTPQAQPKNKEELKKAASNLTKEDLQRFVQQARSQNISEEEIKAGLEFLLNKE